MYLNSTLTYFCQQYNLQPIDYYLFKNVGHFREHSKPLTIGYTFRVYYMQASSRYKELAKVNRKFQRKRISPTYARQREQEVQG